MKMKLEGSDIYSGIKLPTTDEIAAGEAERLTIEKEAEEAVLKAASEGCKVFIEDEDGMYEGTYADVERAFAMARPEQLERFVKEGWVFYDGGILSIERK